MPKFNLHTPKTQSDIKDMRIIKVSLPVGLIGENNDFAYGYDGDKYYVTEGSFQYIVTRMHLSFDEAKHLFEALTFQNASEPCTKVINALVKYARINKINGKDLFWHFVKGL